MTAESEEANGSSVPPPEERVAVVVNGNAKSVTKDVISTLDQILLGGDLFVSRRIEEGRDIARTIVERGYGTVLTGGGDGTFTVMVTEVVHEARRRDRPLPRFGLLKLGTGNALAWVVGASKAKGRGLAADIQRLRTEAGSRSIRLLEVEGFVAPFCGFGADAVMLRDYTNFKKAVAKTPFGSKVPGELIYAGAAISKTIPSYVFRSRPHCRIVNRGAPAVRIGIQGRHVGPEIPAGEVLYEGPAQIAGFSTIPYFGYGFRAFPYADERDDRLHVRVSTISALGLVRNFGGVWRGDYENPDVFFDYLVEHVSVDLDPPTPFQIGGDPQGDRSQFEVQLSPTPIRLVDFYAPPRAT